MQFVAKVRSTGAVATLLESAGDTTNILLYLFAKLDIGALVIGQRATTFAPNTEIMSVEDIGEGLQHMLGYGDLRPDHRRSHWGELVERLAAVDVHTDPETLVRLPFEIVPDASVRALFDDA